METYDEWLDAYSEAYDLVPGTPTGACPHCGQRQLRLVFTGDPDRIVGYAHFWCDSCLHGIGVSRTTIPDGAILQDIRLPRGDREPRIPNFQLVQ
jgi:hypothetical protein